MTNAEVIAKIWGIESEEVSCSNCLYYDNRLDEKGFGACKCWNCMKSKPNFYCDAFLKAYR